VNEAKRRPLYGLCTWRSTAIALVVGGGVFSGLLLWLKSMVVADSVLGLIVLMLAMTVFGLVLLRLITTISVHVPRKGQPSPPRH
jgi:hypothetical protein